MGASDLEMEGGIRDVDQPLIELVEDLLEKQVGEAFCDLLFFMAKVEQTAIPWSRAFVGLRYAQASSSPRPRDNSKSHFTCPLLNSQPSPFVPATTLKTATASIGLASIPVRAQAAARQLARIQMRSHVARQNRIQVGRWTKLPESFTTVRTMMSADEEAIRDLVDAWMIAPKAGDRGAVLSLMADDIVFTVPGREPFGKKEFAQNSKVMAGIKFEGTAEIVEIRILGDWAWLRNRIKATIALPSGETLRQTGYTLSILAKDAEGKWLLKRDANCLAPE